MTTIRKTDTEPCPECGGTMRHRLQTEKSGVKNIDNRDPTEKHVFICDDCGAEGRKFVDGVSGHVTESGALRA